jgi:hypothetical protein
VRTDGYLREFYRRQVRKFGGFRSPAAKKKAIITVAHKLIVIIWHVLATGRPYQDLGADYFTTRTDPERSDAALSPSSRPKDSKSLSSPPPNTPNTHCHEQTRLRCAPPGAFACVVGTDSRTRSTPRSPRPPAVC